MVHVKSGTPVEAEVEAVMQKLPEASQKLSIVSDLEFTTPSGKAIKMGRPTIPVKLLLPALMAAAETNAMSAFYTENLVRQILHVKEVNGKSVSAVENFSQIQAIALQLGDEGLEAVEIMHNKYFPSLTEAQLTIVKK